MKIIYNLKQTKMKVFKKLKTHHKNYLKYLVNGEKYRAYKLGELPKKFGTDKITNWFEVPFLGTGHSGLVFISEDNFETWN